MSNFWKGFEKKAGILEVPLEDPESGAAYKDYSTRRMGRVGTGVGAITGALGGGALSLVHKKGLLGASIGAGVGALLGRHKGRSIGGKVGDESASNRKATLAFKKEEDFPKYLGSYARAHPEEARRWLKGKVTWKDDSSEK